MESDRLPKWLRGLFSKPSDRVGSTQIGQNEMEVPTSVVDAAWQRLEEMCPSSKQFRGIESKPSDRVGLTQIGQNDIEFSSRLPKSFMEGYCQRIEERCRRIKEEYREIKSNPSPYFACRILERNLREWLFGIRGPSGTEYVGGIYIGKILFPKEYPLKPPSFVFLTTNGRFKTHNKIRIKRLDEWQPSWLMRDALDALIEEMPTDPDGGSVEYSKKQRREWARSSRAAAPECSSPERQKLVEEIHNYLLSKSSPDPVPSQNHGAKRKHGTGSGGGANGSVVNVIGNIFNANNSKGVGILDSMNEASNPKKAKLDDHV
ncbi:PREDICTED: ubiquitin-conjugating enzyme E2 32-like [Prunus mume]|uniref:Ubiquitin-conjugating enzyme E2 32-like n=1 Tax=Prunus mume TaxID=102107 RepID=A0ABM1LN38_PRUMU|nr:PREDICTED: ubiquitin-conjugating enzyme E2 32-like [Prunus mume]